MFNRVYKLDSGFDLHLINKKNLVYCQKRDPRLKHNVFFASTAQPSSKWIHKYTTYVIYTSAECDAQIVRTLVIKW